MAARFPSLLCRRPLKSLALAPPRARLSLISRHLEQRPLLEINTPFSTERIAGTQDDLEYTPIQRDPPESPKAASPENQKVNMSGQAEHPALLIPGPIEFDDAVLLSMGHFRCARCPALAIALTESPKSEPCWTSVRRYLWRDPHNASKALPDLKPGFSTFRHIW